MVIIIISILVILFLLFYIGIVWILLKLFFNFIQDTFGWNVYDWIVEFEYIISEMKLQIVLIIIFIICYLLGK